MSELSEYRAGLRARKLSRHYSGLAHLGFTSAASLAAIGYSLTRLDRPSWLECAVVPVTFFYANLVEFLAHRGPMHHPRPGLGLIFERHTIEHHHFFTREAMTIEGTPDFKLVLFPPVMLVFFLGLFATPVGLLIYRFLSPNAGFLFVATALSYFLNYEWFHLLYHWPPESFLGRLPFVRRLRQHHATHHDPALMSRYNFNITYPICDRIFRTLR